MQRSQDLSFPLQRTEAVHDVGQVASESALPTEAALDGEGQAIAAPSGGRPLGHERYELERPIFLRGKGDEVDKPHGHDREEEVCGEGIR